MPSRIAYDLEKCSKSGTKEFASFYALLRWCRGTSGCPIIHGTWRNRSHPLSVFILAFFFPLHPHPSLNERCSGGNHPVKSSLKVCVRPSTSGIRRYNSTSLPRPSSSSMLFFSSLSSPLFSSPSSTGDVSRKHSPSSGDRSTLSRSSEAYQGSNRSPSLGTFLNAVRFSPAFLRHAPSSQYYTLSNAVIENPAETLPMEGPSCPSFSSFLRPSPYRHRIVLLDDATSQAPSPTHLTTPPAHVRTTGWEGKSETSPLPYTSGVYLLSTTTADNVSFSTSFSSPSVPSPALDAAGGKANSSRAGGGGGGGGGGAVQKESGTVRTHAVWSTLIGLPEVEEYASLQAFVRTHQSLLSTVRVVCLPEITLTTRRVLEVLFQECFRAVPPTKHTTTTSSSGSPSFVEGEDEEDGGVQVWCSDFGKAFLLDDHFYTMVLKSVMEEEMAMEKRCARHLSFGSGKESQKNPGRTSSLPTHYQWLSLPFSPTFSSIVEEVKSPPKRTNERAGKDLVKEGKGSKSFRIPPSSVHVVPSEGSTLDGCGVQWRSSSTSIGKREAGEEEEEKTTWTWRRPIQAVKLIEDTPPPSSSSSPSRRPAHYSNAPVFFYDPVFQGIFVGKSILRLPWLSSVLSSVASSLPKTPTKERGSLFFSQKEIPAENDERPAAKGHRRAKGVDDAATFPACKRCYPMPFFTHLHDAKRREEEEEEGGGGGGGDGSGSGGGDNSDPRSVYSRTSRHSLSSSSSSFTNGDDRQGNSDCSALLSAVGPSPEVLGVRSSWDALTCTDMLCRGLQSFPLPLGDDPNDRAGSVAVITRQSNMKAPRAASLSVSCMRFLPPQRVLSAQFGEIPGGVSAVVAELQESAKELTVVKKCFLNALFSPAPVRCMDEVERCRAAVVPTALALLWTTCLHDGDTTTTTTAKDVGRNDVLTDGTSCLPLTPQEAEEWSPFVEWCFPSYRSLGLQHSSSDGVSSTPERAVSAEGAPPHLYSSSGRKTLSAWGRMLECVWFSAFRLSSSPSFRKEMAQLHEKRRRREENNIQNNRFTPTSEQVSGGGENSGKRGKEIVQNAIPFSSETLLPNEWCGKAGIALLNSIFCQKHLSGLSRVVNREEIDVQVFLSMTGEEIQKIFKPTFGLRKKIEGLQKEIRNKVQQVIAENNGSEDRTRDPKAKRLDRAVTRDVAPEYRFAKGREQDRKGSPSHPYFHAQHHGSRNSQDFPTEKRTNKTSRSERNHSLRDRETPPKHYFGADSSSGITSI